MVFPSQRYLSTRGGSYDCSFENVVLQGLASDGGLFIPQEIPSINNAWEQDNGDSWLNWDFETLALRIFSLYIDSEEIPTEDLSKIINKSYASFRAPEVTPLLCLDKEKGLHLLELFHGPTFAFKDVALQFLGFVFEYFLVRHNESKADDEREHLTVIGATSGDTGSAAIYGLRAKKDLSILILHPEGRISPIQEAQMTSVLDSNVHNLAVDGSFDDCQDFVKALFGDEDIKKTHRLAAVNSINWARILAQITYYFYSYATMVKDGRIKAGDKICYAVPTGNFGDVLAGFFAKRMGLPVEKLVVATNENDILYRFWRTGSYEKKPVHGEEASGGFTEDGVKAHEEGVLETFSPAMDILVSSNFERLLWLYAFDIQGEGSVAERRKIAGEKVRSWLMDLKNRGGFSVEPRLLEIARIDFESERVSDQQTLSSIRDTYSQKAFKKGSEVSSGTTGTMSQGGYILDPHSAVGVAGAYRSLEKRSGTQHIALATAHPAKFSKAVEEALKEEKAFKFQDILPEQFRGLENLPRRKTTVKKSDGIEGMRKQIRDRVPASAIR